METNIFEINKKQFYIVPLGDMHVGHKNFNKKHFMEVIETIKKTDNMYFVGMGDFADAITANASGITDSRFSFETLDLDYPTPYDQYKFVYESFKPIASKCIGLHEGNHDGRLVEKYNHPYVKELCEKLNVPYLGYVAFTLLDVKPLNKEIVLLSAHGNYGGGRVGGNLNRIEDYTMSFDADVYFFAHTHNSFWFAKPVKALGEDNHIVEYKKVFVNTASFLEGYVEGGRSYVELKLKMPTYSSVFALYFSDGNLTVREI